MRVTVNGEAQEIPAETTVRGLIALLALADDGRPSYDADHAAALAGIGVPAFACTPDLFPDLMAAAIQRQDIGAWAAANGIVTNHADTPPSHR